MILRNPRQGKDADPLYEINVFQTAGMILAVMGQKTNSVGCNWHFSLGTDNKMQNITVYHGIKTYQTFIIVWHVCTGSQSKMYFSISLWLKCSEVTVLGSKVCKGRNRVGILLTTAWIVGHLARVGELVGVENSTHLVSEESLGRYLWILWPSALRHGGAWGL